MDNKLKEDDLKTVAGGADETQEEHDCGEIEAGVGVECPCGLVANLLTHSGEVVHWTCACGRKNRVTVK